MSITKTPRIIAEVASAHNGSSMMLREIVSDAYKSGADYVKLQIFSVKHLAHKCNELYDNLAKIEINASVWKQLLNEFREQGIPLIAECFDSSSLELAINSEAFCGYKIPSCDIDDYELLSSYANIECDNLFIGSGGSYKSEITACIEALGTTRSTTVLMYGFQNFPTTLADLNLRDISNFASRYGLKVGYADHSDSLDITTATTLSAAAVALGAGFIEKHVTKDRAAKGPDYETALETSEFAVFVKQLRQLQIALSSDKRRNELSTGEARYRSLTKKVAFTTQDIFEGKRLSEASLEYLRGSGSGLTRHRVRTLIDSRVARYLVKGTQISEDDLC